MIVLLGILLISSAAAGLVWMALPTSCRAGLRGAGRTTSSTADRVPTRRVHHLQRRPERAHRTDLERMLAGNVPSHIARFVLEQGERGQVPTGLLWAWAHRHGGFLLALVLAAGLSREDLEWHLGDAGSLDIESLEMSAELNGYRIRPVMIDLWRLVPLEATADRLR